MAISDLVPGLTLLKDLLLEKSKESRQKKKDNALVLREAANQIRKIALFSDLFFERRRARSGEIVYDPRSFSEVIAPAFEACAFLNALFKKIAPKSSAGKMLAEWRSRVQLYPPEAIRLYH